MARPKPDAFMRHEPVVEVVKRRPITERNMKAPPVRRPDDDADTFGQRIEQLAKEAETRMGESTIVKRDRTPKGVNDGRGKRSVADVLLSHPTPEGKAVYALQRIASLEDQISKVLDLCDEETLSIIFKRRESLKHYKDE